MRIGSIDSISKTGSIDAIERIGSDAPTKKTQGTLLHAFNSKKIASEFGRNYHLPDAKDEKNPEKEGSGRLFTNFMGLVDEEKLSQLERLITEYNQFYIPALEDEEIKRFNVSSGNIDYLLEIFNDKVREVKQTLYSNSSSKYINTTA